MHPNFDHYANHLVQDLRQDPALPGRLAQQEADIVRQALSGHSFQEIARAHNIPEVDVWEVLGNAARVATDRVGHA
jgi:hypothetical protein